MHNSSWPNLMVCTISEKQNSRTFKNKLQFSRSKIYSINWHSLTPFEHLTAWNTQWRNFIYDFYIFSHGWSSLTLWCTTFLNNTTFPNDNSHWVWLVVLNTEIVFERKKQRWNIVASSFILGIYFRFTIHVNCTFFSYALESNFPENDVTETK